MDMPEDIYLTEPPAKVVDDLSEVFGAGFRVSPPNRINPYYLVHHGARAVVAIERVESLFLQSGDVWSGINGEEPIVVADRLATIRANAVVHSGIGEAGVVPILWMVQGIPDVQEPQHPNLVAASVATAVDGPVRAALAKLGTPSDETVRQASKAFAGNAAATAVAAQASSGPKLRKILDALVVILDKPEALGGRRILAMGHPVTTRDIADPAFLLPAVAMAAHEDWRVATTRRTHGTGFKVRMDEDPGTLLGFRLTDVRPSIPYVFIAPVLACLTKLEKDGVINLDDVIHQFKRWCEKNGIDATISSR